MTKEKLIQLRCRAWGITEDEYYVKQCGDFEIEDMNRVYRRGRNKVNEELEKEREMIKNVMYEFLNCMEEHYCPTEESLKIAKEFTYGKRIKE